MLRSIVYQLTKDATLCRHFVPIFREKRRIHEGGDWEWQRSELKNFVLSVVKQPRSRPLLLLVDALDECDEQDVRDVVGFLESLSIAAVRVGVTLRIYLSSRHFPYVSIRRRLS
ncbi:hypothetical protein GQ53DRAFT_887515 [Thozetella sp. PMI_491]|nr:hypothetical protein GQ53DRAFT_887515 [Thozetella sp. PMI_491]